MTGLRISILAAALLAVAAARPAAAGPDEEARALDLARTLVAETHGAMTDAALTAEARGAALRDAVSRAFAFDVWEQFLLQGRESSFDPAQTAEFRALLPGFLANLYADQFGKGLDRSPVVESARPARRDVLVSATIPRAGGKTLPVEWRVREFGDGGARVIDVMVGGASFLILKREEFGALIDQGGAERVLAYMRDNAI